MEVLREMISACNNGYPDSPLPNGKLNSEWIKTYILSQGAAKVGVAPADRFNNLHPSGLGGGIFCWILCWNGGERIEQMSKFKD